MFRNRSGYPNESSNIWEAITPIAIQAHCFLVLTSGLVGHIQRCVCLPPSTLSLSLRCLFSANIVSSSDNHPKSHNVSDLCNIGV
uniref:Uncharacterized protein n=1 Tax=Ixodes ricinus TaxID=34613 RepID=A0A131Y6J6_IXORI